MPGLPCAFRRECRERGRKIMNSYKVPEMRRSVLIAALLFGGLSLPTYGQTFGLAGGITRDSDSGKPVAQAQIVAHNLGKGTDQSTVSDAEGIFTFTNLEPGLYEFAALKSGFQKSSAHIEVAALRTARVDLPLRSAASVRQSTAPTGNLESSPAEKELLDRIAILESRLA